MLDGPRPPRFWPALYCRAMPRRSAHRLLLAVASATLTACGGGAPPAAEFVLAAGDSSWWVRTGPDVGGAGVAVRRAPLVLARLDGRFHELFVTEEDYSFPDAAFTSQSVWRRDLVTNDSVVVFGDPTVARLALAYARANPGAFPLDGDEAGSDEPSASAALEVAVADVHGPWLVVETFADVHPARGPELHRARRGVVDLRTGRVQSLARLVGDSAARAAVARGRLAFARARDSLRRTPGDAGGRAVAALSGVAFDERSFALGDARGPSVVFHVPVGDEAGHTLPLAPIALPDGDWWREARIAAPSAAESRGGAEWRRDDLVVRLRPRRRDAAYDVVLRARGREWAVARVALPVDRLHWIDTTVTGEHRAALVRAFDTALRYDGTYSAVARRRRQAAVERPPILRPASQTAAPAPARRHPVRTPTTSR